MAVRVLTSQLKSSAKLPLTGTISWMQFSSRSRLDKCLLKSLQRGIDILPRHTRCSNVHTLSASIPIQLSCPHATHFLPASTLNKPNSDSRILSGRGTYSGNVTTVSVRGMAGHSHWANIKHAKGLADKAKSDISSKIVIKVKAAAKEGGVDPAKNVKLQAVLLEAKTKNIPKATIDKLLQKLAVFPDPFYLEVQGPEGVFIIAEVESINRTQARSSLNQTVKRIGMTSDFVNKCRHMFEEKGVISVVTTKEMHPVNMDTYLEVAIEAGAEDVIVVEEETEDGTLPVLKFHCDPIALQTVKTAIENCDLEVSSAEIEFQPKHFVNVSPAGMEVVEKMYYRLSLCEGVVRTFDNVSVPEE